MSGGGIHADALKNLRTHENSLSVWKIEADKRNLQRVLAALAATRDKIEKLDYALVDKNAVLSLKIRCVRGQGDTLDYEANGLWHKNLECLTGIDVVRLAELITDSGQSGRIHDREIAEMISNSIQQGFIDPSRVRSSLRESLNSLLWTNY